MLPRTALSTTLDTLAAASVPASMPASAGLEELLRDMSSSSSSSSNKRPKQSHPPDQSNTSPRSASTMINFPQKNAAASSKFDMTDLFAAAESENNTHGDFVFPSLSWDLGDDDETDVGGDALRVGGRGPCRNSLVAASKALLHDSTNDLLACCASTTNGLLRHGEASRQVKSTSCLLGKRNRGGGLLRSQTMRSEVDRLVNRIGDPLPNRLTSR